MEAGALVFIPFAFFDEAGMLTLLGLGGWEFFENYNDYASQGIFGSHYWTRWSFG